MPKRLPVVPICHAPNLSFLQNKVKNNMQTQQ
jgi:hypothetical protein